MKKLLSLFLACLVISCLCIAAFAAGAGNDSADYTIDTPYDFPVVPGSDEWAELDSLEEKIAACAVDESLLKSMTTEALMETVLNYPLLINIYAFGTTEEGLASVAEYFQGIEILFCRYDVAACIQAAQEATTYSEGAEDLLKESYLEALANYIG